MDDNLRKLTSESVLCTCFSKSQECILLGRKSICNLWYFIKRCDISGTTCSSFPFLYVLSKHCMPYELQGEPPHIG